MKVTVEGCCSASAQREQLKEREEKINLLIWLKKVAKIIFHSD